jgi:nucleoside 2-deoxyribosyltransferase
VARVYWANSIFGEADRAFNARCVALLRTAGHVVANPQENLFNERGASALAGEIFSHDTDQLTRCDVLVACLDQETIDCGVACELGIAWALGKRLIGLYTDFRQQRTDKWRMYKNPYVIGCIESRGRVVSSVDDLLTELGNGD